MFYDSVIIQELFNITNNISSNVSSYNISFYNSSSNVISRTSTHPVCDADICQYIFNMSFICEEGQKVTISAINQLGQGSSITMITPGMECVVKQFADA
jgi:hypothetical protein